MISLQEAQALNPNASQAMCDGLEAMVRRLTNNNFQVPAFRMSGLTLENGTVKGLSGRSDVFRVGDRVEINGTDFNDGLYTVTEASDGVLRVDKGFIPETAKNAILTKIDYPADVLEGVKKLLNYDAKMGDKIGVKSESVARWSVTYYDMTSSESKEGYPAVLLGFLDKYRKIRWS